MELPRHLAQPKAVIWDGAGRRPALLYVFDAGDDPRLGRIAIRVDYHKKGQSLNDIRSGALVDPSNLKEKGMVLLEGEL